VADTLTFYQSDGSDEWRWRYQAEGNFEKLANGGESYQNLDACAESAFRVCGLRLGRGAEGHITAAANQEFIRDGYSVLVQIELPT
jgi:hypothetical protein